MPRTRPASAKIAACANPHEQRPGAVSALHSKQWEAVSALPTTICRPASIACSGCAGVRRLGASPTRSVMPVTRAQTETLCMASGAAPFEMPPAARRVRRDARRGSARMPARVNRRSRWRSPLQADGAWPMISSVVVRPEALPRSGLIVRQLVWPSVCEREAGEARRARGGRSPAPEQYWRHVRSTDASHSDVDAGSGKPAGCAKLAPDVPPSRDGGRRRWASDATATADNASTQDIEEGVGLPAQ